MATLSDGGKRSMEIFWKRYRADPDFQLAMKQKWRESRIRYWEAHPEPVFIPRLDSKTTEVLKSRLCGFLASDGAVYVTKQKMGHYYGIRFYPDHRYLADLFNDTFEKLYGRRLTIKNYGTYFDLRICSIRVTQDLFTLGKFSSRDWTLPTITKSPEAKAEWLRAYFDGDGYVCDSHVRVQSVNKEGIEIIKNLLEEFNIESKIYVYVRKQKQWGINYILNINKKNMLKFMERVGFNHPAKAKRLRDALS